MHSADRLFRVSVTNLYDLFRVQNGSLSECEVRRAVLDAVIDLRVLSLELPAKTVDALGLVADPEATDRLSIVRLAIGDCLCTIQPVRGTRELPVVGHLALTSLGLKLNAAGELVEELFMV